MNKAKVALTLILLLIITLVSVLYYRGQSIKNQERKDERAKVLKEYKDSMKESEESSSSTSASASSSSSKEIQPSSSEKENPVEMSPDEATIMSFVYKTEEITGQPVQKQFEADFDAMLSTIKYMKVAEIEESTNAHLNDTSSPMRATVYIYLIHEGYQVDKSYTRLWKTYNEDIVQSVIKAHADGKGDAYFLAYYNVKTRQFSFDKESGGTTPNSTFG